MFRIIFHIADENENIVGNYDMDVDDKTSIGINYQVYDIQNPLKRYKTTSNNFNIPATAKNLFIIGNPNSTGGGNHINNRPIISNSIYCTYIIDNDIVLNKQNVYVSEITDRISLLLTSSNKAIDLLKSITWDTLCRNYCEYTMGSSPFSLGSAYAGQWGDFISTQLSILSNVLKVPYSYSNAYMLEQGIDIDTTTQMYFFNTTNSDDVNKGYSSRFAISLEFLINSISNLSTYDPSITDIYVQGGSSVRANLLSDPTAEFDNQYYDTWLTCPNLIIIHDETDVGTYPHGRWYFNFLSSLINGLDGNGLGLAGNNGKLDKEPKTLYDLFIVIAQMFNCLITFNEIDGSIQVKFQHFDLIDSYNNVNVVDWSKNIKAITKFKPFPDGFKQNNYIQFESFSEKYNEKTSQLDITCENRNLEYEGTLFKIKAHIPYDNGERLIYLNDNKVYDEFVFLTFFSDGVTSVALKYDSTVNQTYHYILNPRFDVRRIQPIPLTNIYSLYQSIMAYPRIFEIEKYLTVEEVRNLDFTNQYYIDQLGGTFFINKISGYNPLKSQDATKIELVAIGLKIPNNVPLDNNYWVDGIGDFWTDGVGDSWSF